jgi:hypothetical protein
LVRRDVNDTEIAESNVFTDEVDVQLDVLRALVMDGVLAHVDGGDVVAVGHSSAGNIAVKLMKELPEPDALGHSVGHNPVLGFHAGTRHRGLALR